jgi:glutaredoxin
MNTPDTTPPYAPPVARITLYSRPDCHLCDDARAVIERVGEPFDEVDIDGDDELLKRYLERIPVVLIDGGEAFELFVHEDALRSRLQ